MEKIKKILFYNDSPIWGGHEKMSVKFANTLSNEYEVIFIYHNKEYKKYLNKDIISIETPFVSKVPFPFIRNMNFKDIYNLKQEILKINPDIVVAIQGTIELSSKVLLASKWAKKYTISYIPIAYDFSYMRNNKIHMIRDIFNKIYYKCVDLFITPSQMQVKYIKEKINAKVIVIENPIQIDSPSINRKFEIIKKDNILNIVYIGRLRKKHKNTLFLIKIAKLLLQKNIPFSFHIIGGGEDEKNFKNKIVQNSLKKYFTFYGWVEEKDIANLIKDKSFAIIPSNFETQPLILFELLYHEMPFIVSDIEAFEDIPKNYKFSITDTQDISNILDKIVKNELDFKPLMNLKAIKLKEHNNFLFEKKLKSFFGEIINNV